MSEPLVAVLCAPSRMRASAAAVALALAGATGRAPALAGAVGAAGGASGGGTLRARRAVAHLEAHGGHAVAVGRLVWIAGEAHGSHEAEHDPAGAAAAAAATQGRAAAALRAPAALALPLPRTAALDRVLAWHDAIVVVREPGASEALFERALASFAALGRPVATMAPSARVAAALAGAGLRAPAEAVRAVAQLGLSTGARDRRRG